MGTVTNKYVFGRKGMFSDWCSIFWRGKAGCVELVKAFTEMLAIPVELLVFIFYIARAEMSVKG